MANAPVCRQRGAAALPAVMILFFILVLAVLYANRGLIFEQRTSANQYRSTQAFETAEAGLEWAVANLNNHKLIDASCASNAAGGTSFKDRYTTINATTGTITPSAIRAACVVNGDGTYSCSCPAAGVPAPAGSGAVFAVQFAAPATPQPGVMQVIVHGCTSTGDGTRDPRCIAGSTGTSDGYAKVSMMVGLLPALATAPAATITAKGTVGWTGAGAGVGVINSDPASNGITINAGSTVDESKARIVTIPGSPPASSIIENDTSLSGLTDGQMFQTFFGLSKEAYKSLATVITCPTNCANVLEAAVNGSDGPFWVEGDMEVTSNVSIGSVNKPVALVVNGDIRLSGTMDIFGIVYSAHPIGGAPNWTWNNTGGGSAFLRGAAVSEGSFTGNGTPDFFFDATVLRTLTTTMGSFAKIPGSWKDF